MVPFLRILMITLAIYLKDLTFINDGNSTKINGLLNIDKLRSMAERVLEITALADKPYAFKFNGPIQNYISKPPLETDQTKLKALASQLDADSK